MTAAVIICTANQWTGFYMITASVMKELVSNTVIFNNKYLRGLLSCDFTILFTKNTVIDNMYQAVIFRESYFFISGNCVFFWTNVIYFGLYLHIVFCEFCEISQNTSYIEHRTSLVAASVQNLWICVHEFQISLVSRE